MTADWGERKWRGDKVHNGKGQEWEKREQKLFILPPRAAAKPELELLVGCCYLSIYCSLSIFHSIRPKDRYLKVQVWYWSDNQFWIIIWVFSFYCTVFHLFQEKAAAAWPSTESACPSVWNNRDKCYLFHIISYIGIAFKHIPWCINPQFTEDSTLSTLFLLSILGSPVFIFYWIIVSSPGYWADSNLPPTHSRLV